MKKAKNLSKEQKLRKKVKDLKTQVEDWIEEARHWREQSYQLDREIERLLESRTGPWYRGVGKL